ncbi:aminoglycoside adenylyltransferase domain-containing protein [Nonomuraea salmonea]|uniref:aminoglycoside adenylyltransferase domain-containing protein n=1 Tax=Nonomuraea salmonea TaxID=46181 RepID=UPI002FEC4C76
MTSLGAYGTVWVVTGVSRLHYTLATGEIASKTDAALHALETFPERWHRVVNEALRLRQDDSAQPSFAGLVSCFGEHFGTPRRSLYGSPFERRRDVLEFAGHVIVAGHRLFQARGIDREAGPGYECDPVGAEPGGVMLALTLALLRKGRP